MDGKARWFGLAAVMAAGVLWWRSLERGVGGGRGRSVPTARPQRPDLVAVPPMVDEPGRPAAAVAEQRRWVEPIDGACPDGYPVKVNERSGIYHVPGGGSYDRTQPTRCYADQVGAEADGFRQAKR